MRRRNLFVLLGLSVVVVTLWAASFTVPSFRSGSSAPPPDGNLGDMYINWYSNSMYVKPTGPGVQGGWVQISNGSSGNGSAPDGTMVSSGAASTIGAVPGATDTSGTNYAPTSVIVIGSTLQANTITAISVTATTNLTVGNGTGTGSIDIGNAGVRLTDDGDGAITFLGLGNGSDENFTINLDDTADTAVITSSTGLNVFNFSGIGITATSLSEGAFGVPNSTDNLSFFSTTTSAQLLGIISDETGSGLIVGGTSPTLTTPVISGAISFPDGVRQIFNPNGTTPGLNVGAQAGDPSTPINGDMWYDSTGNFLRTRIAGVNISLGAGGGGGSAPVGTVVNTGTSVSGAIPQYLDTTGTNIGPSSANAIMFDGTQATRTTTFSLSGATDPVWTYGNNSVDLTVGVLKYGGNTVLTTADGAVIGPASATDNAVTRFDTTTGKLIQNSSAQIDDTGAFFAASSQTTNGFTAIGGSTQGTLRLNDSAQTHFLRFSAPSTIATNIEFVFSDHPESGMMAWTLSVGTNLAQSWVNSSATLATVIGDASGSGVFARATSPTLVTPVIASFTTAQHTHLNAAGGGTLDQASVINSRFPVYGAGTVYSLTTTPALIALGTTTPSTTILSNGVYRITGAVGINYNASTFVAQQTITLKFRKTSGTAADLSNAVRTISLSISATPLSYTVGVYPIPAVYYTATAGDIIQVWGSISVLPGAGTMDAYTAEIDALRVQ